MSDARIMDIVIPTHPEAPEEHPMSEANYAVIFRSRRNHGDDHAYETAATRMIELAEQQEGFVSVCSVRDASRVGITVSYWRDLDSIERWHQLAEHRAVQEEGRRRWYSDYEIQVCQIERAYAFQAPPGSK